MAEDAENAHVAIKVLRDAFVPDTLRWFRREQRVGRKLAHPNVIEILEDGEDNDLGPWYAMPLAAASLVDEVGDFLEMRNA